MNGLRGRPPGTPALAIAGYAWRSATDDGNVMPADMRGHDWIAIGPWSTGLGVAVGAHIARHDPARIVRDVEAKRRILDGVPCTDYLGDASVCRRTLKLLALPYADRPGFRDEWRPFLP